MAAKTPTSKIPQSKGYALPEVKEVVKSILHYRVADSIHGIESRVFLNKMKARKEAKLSESEVIESYDPVKVYEVKDETFATIDEAEKKCNLLTRKHRDSIRQVAEIFGVGRASEAEKSIPMKWILENYSLKELTNFYDPEDIISKHDFAHPFHFYYFSRFPELNPDRIQRDRKWSWLQNRNIDSYWGIPEEYQEVGPLRTAWVYGENDFKYKFHLIKKLVDLRFLELTYLASKNTAIFDSNGTVMEMLSLKEVNKLVDLDLVTDELKDIIKTLDAAELGKDLLINFKKGEVVYSLADFKNDKNPFKRF